MLKILSLFISLNICFAGISNGKFDDCPQKPNCVSSTGSDLDSKRYIHPLKHNWPKEQGYKKIMHIMESTFKSKLIIKEDNYLHYEVTTKILGFTDIVEFYFPEDSNLIHFKSESKKGYYDFGKNRERLEKVRFEFFQGGAIN